jgi:hypothetical protein
LGKRTAVKRVSVPKGSFAVLEQDHGPFYSPDEDIRTILQRITASTKCSQYIAVVKTNLQFKAGARIDGLGIQASGGQYFLWALFTIELHDGRNLALIQKYPPSIGVNFLGVKRVPSRSRRHLVAGVERAAECKAARRDAGAGGKRPRRIVV